MQWLTDGMCRYDCYDESLDFSSLRSMHETRRSHHMALARLPNGVDAVSFAGEHSFKQLAVIEESIRSMRIRRIRT